MSVFRRVQIQLAQKRSFFNPVNTGCSISIDHKTFVNHFLQAGGFSFYPDILSRKGKKDRSSSQTLREIFI